MSKTDTQSYMVVRVNDKTGERHDMLDTPVSHKEAVTIKSKLMSPLPKHLRTVLEPRGPQEKIAIQLEPKVAIRHVFDWGIPTSKSAHAQKADSFHDLAVKMGDEWDATVNLAVEAYGSQGSLISGVYRDHFPEDVKQRLRFLNSAKNLAGDASRLHEYLSTTRSPLFH